MKSKALYVYDVNKIEIRQTEIPEPSADELLIKVEYSAVSPGTELRCMSGKGESDGFPYVPGYSLAGTVVKCGSRVKLREGAKIFSSGTEKCEVRTQWGGHIQYAIATEKNIIELPENFELLDATIARLAAISYHGVRFSQPRDGLKVVVAGLGPIGQLSARIHHALGADVVGGDINEARIALLRKHGIKAVNTSSGIESAFKEFFHDGADVIVDATGVPSLAPELIKVAQDLPWNDNPTEGAKYLIQGSYSADFPLPYKATFMKELSFYVPRNMQKPDYLSVMNLVLDGKLVLSDLASEIIAPENAQIAYDKLRNKKEISGTIVFKWN